jgi:hypothetical protein
METSDILFFYFLQLARDNFRYMNLLEKYIRMEKTNYFVDIFLVYLYITLGLQTEKAMNYIFFYISKNEESLLPTPPRQALLAS